MTQPNLVVTVRLSDIDESDQPDPICLPARELATWRHFEALLKNMYREPPSSIRVCYLDNDSDWVDLGSDLELQEAIKVVQDTDEILQLQVKRTDTTEHTFESTLSSDTPHVTPLQTTYYRDKPAPLVYPHPSNSSTVDYPPVTSTAQHILQPLTYPHPHTSTPQSPPSAKQNENVLLLEANGNSASIQNRPDLSTDEKVRRLKARLSNHKEGEEEELKGLNTCLSFKEMWQQASGYSSEDKVKFMKTLVGGEAGDKEEKTDKADKEVKKGELNVSKDRTKSEALIEPLPVVGVPAKTSATNVVQDPFEFVCQGGGSRDLEEIQLNLQSGSILMPEKSRTASMKSSGSVDTEKVKSSTVMVNMCRDSEKALTPTKGKVSSGRHEESARPSAALVEPVAPVPLPRNLQIMEGAQSGANAVAIEIPEGYHHGAAQKEEDITACGGAACTSVSGETGEAVVTRTSHEGAAVSHKVAGTPRTRSSSKRGRKPETAKSAEEVAASKSKKEVATKPASCTLLKKKSSSSQDKKCTKEKEGRREDKGHVRMEADVESGEKVVRKEGDITLQYNDFTRYMKKIKKDLHDGIVKDVTKVTGKLLTQRLSRSVSCDQPTLCTKCVHVVHRGIYCDHCNEIIKGIRFKCGNCADYDLCEKCETRPGVHDPTHVFLKLPRPVWDAGRIGREKIPLLREVVYKERTPGYFGEQIKRSQSERLGQVPILSVSEVATPGKKASPPSTPPESRKKIDVSNWVWDSTFDTDQQNLYPMEEKKPAQASKLNNSFGFSDSEMKRLVGLLSLEAEAAKRENEILVADGGEEVEEPQPQGSANKEDEEGEANVADAEQAEQESHGSVEFVHAPAEEEEEEEEVETGDDFEELIAVDGDGSEDEREESNTEPIDYQLLDHPEPCGSDTSDDFCVLDPPSRDACEACIVDTTFLSVVGNQETEVEAVEISPCLIEAPVREDNREGQGHGQEASGVSPTVETPEIPGTETVNEIPEQPEAVNKTVEVEVEEELMAKQEVCKNESESQRSEVVGNSSRSESHVSACVEEGHGTTAASAGSDDGKELAARSIDYHEEDMLMNMSVEERRRFLDMVKSLKDRADDLEKELKIRKEEEVKEKLAKQEEMELQKILEEKQKEAVRENEKLEELRKKEQEEKRQRQAAERERKSKLRNRGAKQTGPGIGKRSGTTTLGSKPTLMQMALNSKDQSSTSSAMKSDCPAGKPVPPVSVEERDVPNDKRDADCQTGAGSGDGAVQASLMLQNVASGVSKVAEAAFHTAKDVFYSLQAKQVEKKSYPGVVYSRGTSTEQAETSYLPPTSVWTPPADTFVPVKSNWTPPKSEWTPPKSDYTPPKSDYTPPKSEWTGPKSEWNPPAGYYQQPDLGVKGSEAPADTNQQAQNDGAKAEGDAGEKAKAGRLSSSPPKSESSAVDKDSLPLSHIPPLSPSQIADPVLRREVQGMQTLIEMGFANREQNRKLLQQYEGNVEKVVQVLLQEERGEHWAWQRH